MSYRILTAIPMILLLFATAISAKEPEKIVEQIASLVDESTFMVAHLDLEAVDVDKLIDRATLYFRQMIKLSNSDDDSARIMKEFKKIIDEKGPMLTEPLEKFRKETGLKEAFCVGSLAEQPFMFILAFPIKDLTAEQTEALNRYLDQIGSPREIRLEKNGFLMFGGLAPGIYMDPDEIAEALENQLDNFKPKAVPALLEAFALRKDDPLKAAFIMPKGAAKMLKNLVDNYELEVPAPIFGFLNYSTLKLKWAVVGFNPEQPEMQAVVKANSVSAAKDVYRSLEGLIEIGVKSAQATAGFFQSSEKHKDGMALGIQFYRGVMRMCLPYVDDDKLIWEMKITPESLRPEIVASVGIYTAITLPAIQAAREAARRMQCANNLKQILLAFHNYYDAQNCLPPIFTLDENRKPLHSWRVLILPYLEQSALYEQIRLDEPWDSEHNKQFHEMMPGVYRCPSSNSGPGLCDYSVIMGEETAFLDEEGKVFNDITDGTSNTICVVERKTGVNWMDPLAEITFEEACEGINGKDCKVGSRHTGGINVAMFDGSVRFISQTIDLDVWKAALTISGGEAVPVP